MDTIKKYQKSGKLLVIEPSGIAAGETIHQALSLHGYDVQTISLVDVEHFEKRTPQEKTIMKNQLEVSNMIGLTWLGKDESPIHNFLCENGKHANFHIDIAGNIETYREIVHRVVSCPHTHSHQNSKKKSSLFSHEHHENCSHSHENITPIDIFRNEHFFLSNFYPAPIFFSTGKEFADNTYSTSITYPTAEHAYQACKTLNRKQHIKIAHASSPAEAKEMGQNVRIRPDWEDKKIDIMRAILEVKFAHGSVLAEQLKATAPRELIEGNTWDDTFWGMCEGVGQNWLGRLLMERRDILLETSHDKHEHHKNCSHHHGLKSVHTHTHNPFHTQSIEHIHPTDSLGELQNVIDFL